MGKFKLSPGVNNALTNMGAKKVGVLSRGQRKRLAKKNNLVAKKSFVKVLTALDEKDRKKKKYGRLQVGDVSKMFEDVAKEIASRNPYTLKKKERGAGKAVGTPKKASTTILLVGRFLSKQITTTKMDVEPIRRI